MHTIRDHPLQQLEPERIAAALERLQTSGMVTSEKYARGELFYIIA